MRVLITAGNTQALIDQVRCITNVFTGRTGATIAAEAARRGHAVTLLTSHPKAHPLPEGVEVVPYRTFDDLHRLMEQRVREGAPDTIVHCAAVSDYLPVATYSVPANVRFEAGTATWHGDPPRLRDLTGAGKIKSDESELWLRMVRAPKLIDRVRQPWGFTGVLVKFKLEVGPSDEELLRIAERSRQHSSADLMVANTLEGASS
jgi:phosphopantothenoylcysteine synthetase/decarboxylase